MFCFRLWLRTAYIKSLNVVNNSLLLAHVFHGIFWVYLFSCVTSCVVSCGGNITDDMWLQILYLSCVDMLAYYKQHTTDGVYV